MNRVRLEIDGIIVYDSGAVTPPIPPTPPPIPPIPPPTPTGSELAWNTTTDFINTHPGQTLNFWVSVKEPTRNRMEMLVFGEDLSVAVNCTFTFPDGRSWQQSVGYGGNTNTFYWRTQTGYSPNLPDLYLPVGVYALKIGSTGNGRIRIRTRLD